MKCRKYTKKIATYIFINQSTFLGSLCNSFYRLYIGDREVSTWILPFYSWVPFDIDEVWKWYTLWTIQFAMGFCYCSCITTITSYFICCCLYIEAICDHFNCLLNSVMDDTKRNQKNTNPLEHERRLRQINKNLSKSIQIHVKVFE